MKLKILLFQSYYPINVKDKIYLLAIRSPVGFLCYNVPNDNVLSILYSISHVHKSVAFYMYNMLQFYTEFPNSIIAYIQQLSSATLLIECGFLFRDSGP